MNPFNGIESYHNAIFSPQRYDPRIHSMELKAYLHIVSVKPIQAGIHSMELKESIHQQR